jgi:hypothetical protein
VHFYRWDALAEVYVDIANLYGPPYALDIHASELNYEWNQVFVRVYDAAGNVSESAYIWIYQSVEFQHVYLSLTMR